MKMKQIYQLISLLTIFIVLIGCNNQEGEPTTNLSGEEIFRQSCLACHSSDTLKGGSYKLQLEKLHKDYIEKEKLYRFISKNMPEDAPQSLTIEQYEAVTDYLWYSGK
jgi:mono/diheme cytochrome c family protein